MAESKTLKVKKIRVRSSGPDEGSELRDIAEYLETAEDLNVKSQRILELLEGDGRKMLKNDPGILSKMVEKAPILIESSKYVKIIQKMTDIYKAVGCRMQNGPLTYLVDEMEDVSNVLLLRNQEVRPSVFVRHQEDLLSIIQILLSAEDSTDSRTRCLRVLIKYAAYVAVPYQHDAYFQWTGDFFEVLKCLLIGGADPTWIPKDVTILEDAAVYEFFKSIGQIIANELHQTSVLMKLYPLFLTEQSLNYIKYKGSLLHALVKSGWKWAATVPDSLFEQYLTIIFNVIKANPSLVDTTDAFGKTPLHILVTKIETESHILHSISDILPVLISDTNVDVQDKNGRTAYHNLVEMFPLDSSSSANRSNIFLHLINCLKSPFNTDVQDNKGHTVLHLLARKACLHVGHELVDVFTYLTSANNVNLVDTRSTTPYTWVLKGKTVHENNNQDASKIFSKIEEIFLRNGADEVLARGGLQFTTFAWIEEALLDETCSLARLQQLLKILRGSGHDTLIEKPKDYVCFNLDHVCNPKVVHTIMEIMKILVENEANAQILWQSMVSKLNVYSCSLMYLEILCLCAKEGAKPTKSELCTILSLKDEIEVVEKFVGYFKLLVSMREIEDFTFDLEFLKDWYHVDSDVLKLGRELVRSNFEEPDFRFGSTELVKHLLLKSLEQEKCMPFDEKSLEHFTLDNWLQRSVLHLAVIFLDNKKALNCLPKALVSKYIDLGDLHGCTPLHVAYLHHNKDAVEFLVSHGAKEDITDNFGRTPRSLGKLDGKEPLDGIADTLGVNRGVSLTKEKDPDAAYYDLCKNVIDSESGVLEQLRPMVVLSEVEAQAICGELKELFERLVDKTKFSQTVKDIFIAGSLRECLKVGRFDEADVQIRVLSKNLPDCGKSEFYEEMAKLLQESVSKISWDGINLRPVSIKYPWKLIREGGGLYQGVNISVDIVCIKVNEIKDSTPQLELREEILEGGPSHQLTKYALLGRLNLLRDTMFPFEWDILDSLPQSSRLAIAVAKALVVAYDWCKGDHLHVDMPISSYMLKTALFCLLAHNIKLNKTIESLIQTFVLEETETAKRSTCGDDSTTDESEGKNVVNNQWNRPQKLQYNPNPKWITDNDLDQHAEQARVIACRLFRLIKHFARHNYKLASYFRITEDFLKCKFGEAEYIIDTCEFLLKRLEKNVFYTAH